MFNDIAYLCEETITYDSYGNERKTFEESEVFVKPKSIGMREFYTAQTADLKPDITLVLADYYDYNNQKVVKYEGDIYDVTRTYEKNNRLELVLTKRLSHD